MHDNVNQILSTARLYINLAMNNEEDRLKLISKSAEGISNAVNEIRNISRSLAPASIGDLGLTASIEDLVESVQITKKLNIEFYSKGEIESAICSKRKLVLFRIIQEQVTNVLKHAEATNLIIELVIDGQDTHLSISDDGKGFDKESVKAKKRSGAP